MTEEGTVVTLPDKSRETVTAVPLKSNSKSSMPEVSANNWPVSLAVALARPKSSAAALLPLIIVSLTTEIAAPDSEPPPNICKRLSVSKYAVTLSASGPETTTSPSTIVKLYT